MVKSHEGPLYKAIDITEWFIFSQILKINTP